MCMRVILIIYVYGVVFYFHVGEKKTNEKANRKWAVSASESIMNFMLL